MDAEIRALKHSDQLYDYIKFHLELYVATPTVLSIIAIGFGVDGKYEFGIGLALMIAVYLAAGVHASLMIAKHINVSWDQDEPWLAFGRHASALSRRFMHHYLYWFGLLLGLGGLVWALIARQP